MTSARTAKQALGLGIGVSILGQVFDGRWRDELWHNAFGQLRMKDARRPMCVTANAAVTEMHGQRQLGEWDADAELHGFAVAACCKGLLPGPVLICLCHDGSKIVYTVSVCGSCEEDR